MSEEKNQEENSINEVESTRDITKFRQVPFWNVDSEFIITGEEFLKLQNFFAVFTEPSQIIGNIFNRSLDNGTIQVKYLDNSNNEFTKEEITEYVNGLVKEKATKEIF